MKQYLDIIKRVLTADENIILAQLPRPLDTIHTIDDQHLMNEAHAFVERFELAVKIYESNSNDKSTKPRMWPSDYVPTILEDLKTRAALQQLPDRNTAYQVLFIVGVLMRLPTTRAEWWKKTFANKIFQEYFMKTTHFKNQDNVANTIVNKIRRRTEPTLDLFSCMNDDSTNKGMTDAPGIEYKFENCNVIMGNAYNPTFTSDVKLLNDKAYEYRTT
jgi:hypothetical protein